MAPRPARRRRPWWFLGLAVLAVALVAGASGAFVRWRQADQGQAMRIPDDGRTSSFAPPPTSAPGGEARRQGRPFVTSVSPDGRYFLDQYGRPILVRGDSPWALMTRLSPQQARLWFADRQRRGFNAAIVSLIGATDNGALSDDGATFDGLLPFADGDVLRWQEPYWERVTAYLGMAAEHGITVMLYPIDGWTIGHSFVPRSIGQCHAYGAKVARRLGDLPNIVWMSGGDYVPENDYATAARTPDGRLAVVDLPTGRTISVAPEAMAAGARAPWVDPVSGARRAVPMTASFTTPGANAGGDGDWLLVLRAAGAS
jgi:uncharacterized protein DUF4038